jgi:putative aminopeptidase
VEDGTEEPGPCLASHFVAPTSSPTWTERPRPARPGAALRPEQGLRAAGCRRAALRSALAAGLALAGPGLAAAPPAAAPPSASELGDRLLAFLRVAAVGDRGGHAAATFLREALPGKLPVYLDPSGNLTVTLGTGPPRRLVACRLGEPGFIVRRIEDSGFLRLAAAGDSGFTAPGPQTLEGQEVSVATARGEVPGVVAARAIHLQPRGASPAPPLSLADAFVDIGVDSAREAAELGVRTGDPVAVTGWPARLAHDLVAGPSARQKAACLAAAEAAGRLRQAPAKGTVVFAWTLRGLRGGLGLQRLLREGPFSELVVLGPRLAAAPAGPSPPPAPGAGPLAAGALAGRLPGTRAALDRTPELVPGLSPGLPTIEASMRPARIGYLDLPVLYPETAVETVALSDLRQLAVALVEHLGGAPRRRAPASPPSPVARPAAAVAPAAEVSAAAASAPTATDPLSVRQVGGPLASQTAALVAVLVGRHGVSGDETAVRQAIAARLPPWAHPTSSRIGNLVVTAGPATDPEPLLFMAHMDEIGFRVARVLADGRLELEMRGGLFPALWQGRAALVHGRNGPVPAVFEPRPAPPAAGHPPRAGDLTLFLGARGPGEVAASGIGADTTVTMPRALVRLGRWRLAARGLDDRAGAAALLLALHRLDPARLRHRVTFAWTSREEAGLLGAAVLAHRDQGWRRVYPVDAFPTADSPLETDLLADAPLGHGVVLPTGAPRAVRDRLLDLGRRRGIALQLGVAAGTNDGIPFQNGAATVVPLFFPCRYTHSPGEVADLRDLEALTDLVTALAGAP